MRFHSGMGSALARPAFILVIGVCLTASMAGGRGGQSLAQEGEGVATPATPVAIDFTQLVAKRPVEIRPGSCAEPGEAIAALTPLTTPEGEAQGQGEAIEAERSYTSVPLAMESLLTGETNISVLLNGDENAVAIACGEIGGVVSEGGSLVVKLSEQNDSGFTGIAYLGPEDAATAGVSIFLAGELTVAKTRELISATPAADLEPLPEPTPTAEPVQVADLVLFEWMIDMPSEVRAGKINFVVTNEGVEAHSVVIEGQGLVFELPQPLDPADTTILTAELPPGEYVVYCPVGEGEHRAEGMEGTLSVVP